jgi:ATP-dependent HslUV protease ATP-binding subunit HslU
MGVEGVKLEFREDGVRNIAELACDINDRTENIGARRLHTVMERLMDDISFEAPESRGRRFVIDKAYVTDHLADLAQDRDLSRYIL